MSESFIYNYTKNRGKLIMGINKIKSAKKEYVNGQKRIEKTVNDMQRVSSVLSNVENIIDDLDEEFSKKTGIVNKEDLTFLGIAVILQCARWILMPKMDLNFDKISPNDRLQSNETKKSGPYKGKKSGATYENSEINKYKKKHSNKFDAEEDEYRNKLEGNGKYQYRSWIEILMRAVPYDAMNATDESKKLIPSIRGLNSAGSNINGTNHHVATLGHDPVLGWIFGTMNIISQKITFINLMTFDVVYNNPLQLDKWGQSIDYSKPSSVASMLYYCVESINEDTKRLPAAVFRQGIHLQSDKLTKQGLPIPFLSSISPEKAQHIIEMGWNSAEVERLLKKALKDAAIVGTQALICMLINLIIKAIYLMGSREDDKMELKLREVRINKILLISNLIASTSNVLYVAVSRNINKIDLGGIGVSLVNLFKSKDLMEKVKYEFISNGIEQAIIGDEKWEDYYLWEEKTNEER